MEVISLNTPVYDFLRSYASSGTLRCHMPGHKGRCSADIPENPYELDITEICGADSLFEADGIIAESERNMSGLYETAGTVYSAGGSTLCIQTMLALMKQENRRVYAVRNVHRAFLNSAALLDLEVEWIIPEYSGGILSCRIDYDEVEDAVSKCEKPFCIYVTSPDYTGKTADIKTLSAICKKYGARLLVDGAHGAHLAFFEQSCHPIALGADLCCDSAHKMLPALTGAATLHTSSAEYACRLKQTMTLFASTSPSYLIMASLDLCNKYIAEDIRRDIAENIGYISGFREKFSGRLIFAEGEPFHMTIRAAESGYSGIDLARELRLQGVECEYADSGLTVLLMSPMNRREDYQRLDTALDNALKNLIPHEPKCERIELPVPRKIMSIRNAVFAPSEEIPVERAEGRICASVKIPCPPAVPIAVSGELITEKHINIFKRYGILTVNVVK
ncbi:MAG: aminotransferase class I/II-fold pyridoxal phosphate-dependent enzyme [Ruminococcus sp.]|nr:aminotransferase class I/II-fold pyridoxal phosphate-dependent enzyme [Ruminococcus sp.]